MLASYWTSTLVVVPLGTLIGSGLVLLFERKLIAIAQKRLGISFVGRHGWAHLPADVFKFWVKDVPRHVTGVGLGLLGAVGAYLGWALLGCLLFLNGGGAAIDLWDFQLLAYLAYANLTTLMMAGLTCSTRSKFATLASARLILLSAFMEVTFGAVLLAIYLKSGCYSLEGVAAFDSWLLLSSPAMALLLTIYAVFEARRAPFDHSEAESELVAGHLVEFGGRTLLVFFVCEYAHVYFCVFSIVVFVCGGWGSPGTSYTLPLAICRLLS
jgi:NADH-quinone oxidoreductase subunit H